ncbi:MAG: BtrH N-terminal domain-containing protein [Actinomycetota bacterium]
MARVFIEEFPHGPGGHCSSTATRDLLRFYGHDLSEEMTFGLGVGIDFIYGTHPALVPPVYAGGRTRDLEVNLDHNLGLGMEIVSGLDEREGWLAVKQRLDAGIPTMVHADVYHLDYLRAKRHFSAHRVVLVGYDEERGVAFVADNDRDEVQECSLANLALARSSAYPPTAADNTYYVFELPESLRPLSEAIPTALAQAVRQNIGRPLEEAEVEWDGARLFMGTRGVRAFAEEMGSWPEMMDAEMLSLACKTLYVNLEKGGTGYGGNFRRIYGRFLIESAGILGEAGLEDLGRRFISIGDTWTELSTTFREMSSEGERAVEEGRPLAARLAGEEEEAFEGLAGIASSLGG